MDFHKFDNSGCMPGQCHKGIAEMVTGSGAKKARKEQRRQALRQEQLQREQQEAQEAAQNRQQNTLNDEEDKQLSDIAGKRRAIAARRRGRGSLAFTGANGLKSKLGE